MKFSFESACHLSVFTFAVVGDALGASRTPESLSQEALK